jgi:hypothetical protein
VVVVDAVKDATAITPLEIVVAFKPQTSQIMDPAVLLQDKVLPAAVAAGPAVTVTNEKSAVE